MDRTVTKILREIRSLFIIILIALSLRATVIEAYIVPTGSMEDTIMTGDFLIGNKFVFGMRTPDWIGIPYTEWGFSIPWIRFPKFREPHPGDVVIFKYPRDTFQKYVKRCVAGPGQTVEAEGKKVFVDGKKFDLPPQGKLVDDHVFPSSYEQPGIFLGDEGNRDSFGPVRVPRKGDTIRLTRQTDWEYVIPLMLMDGHEVTLENGGGGQEFKFAMKDPNDVARRLMSGLAVRVRRWFSGRLTRPKKIDGVFKEYYRPGNPGGHLLNAWNFKSDEDILPYLRLDGTPMSDLGVYRVAQDYYWMMGDNRDDSADSRYWGFVPNSLMLGEALFVYMSWSFKKGAPRFHRIGTVIS